MKATASQRTEQMAKSKTNWQLNYPEKCNRQDLILGFQSLAILNFQLWTGLINKWEGIAWKNNNGPIE